MKVYKIFNKKTGEYADTRGWGRGIRANYSDMSGATRAVAYCGFNKKNAEIHGFDLTHATTRTNEDGGKWNKEEEIR